MVFDDVHSSDVIYLQYIYIFFYHLTIVLLVNWINECNEFICSHFPGLLLIDSKDEDHPVVALAMHM